MKVVITVEDGIVANVFSDDPSVDVEVLDMDTDDPERAEELQIEYDALDDAVLNQELYMIY